MQQIILTLAGLITLLITACNAACIPCGKMMPLCHCPDKSLCQFQSQSCNECAHYKCDIVDKKPEQKQPGMKHVQKDDLPVQKDQEGQEQETPRRPCVICILAIPSCDACLAAGKQCVIVQQTCHRCAYARCI